MEEIHILKVNVSYTCSEEIPEGNYKGFFILAECISNKQYNQRSLNSWAN